MSTPARMGNDRKTFGSPAMSRAATGKGLSGVRTRSTLCARSMSAEPVLQDPLGGGTLWVMDAQHPSNLTIMTTSPMSWTVRPGHRKSVPTIGGCRVRPEPRNIADIRERTAKELDKRLLHTLTLRERGIRRSAVQREEADDVARLRTPEFGAKEQVVEEVLRQLQGHGPLEQLRESLQAVDRSGAGLVRAEEFRALLTGMDRFTFEDRHVQFLISIAARGAGPVGAPQMVAYPTILEKLNVARNRKMAALQRAGGRD